MKVFGKTRVVVRVVTIIIIIIKAMVGYQENLGLVNVL